MLGYFGSRCWTSTKAIAASRDRCASNSENASNPPAEAPMPTIGKVSLDGWGTATVPRAGKVARCPRVAVLAVLIGEGRAGGRARLLPVGERGDRGDLFIAMLRSRLLAQNASLHRQANVTTVRRECQGFVRPSEMRVCPFSARVPRSNGGTFAPVLAEARQAVAFRGPQPGVAARATVAIARAPWRPLEIRPVPEWSASVCPGAWAT